MPKIVVFNFTPLFFLVKDQVSKKILLHRLLDHGLYKLQLLTPRDKQSKPTCSFSPVRPASAISQPSRFSTFSKSNALTASLSHAHIWHARLGHPSLRILSQILSYCNLPFNLNRNIEFCASCQFGKLKHLPFKLVVQKTTKPLQLIHNDIWGPSPYIHFTDDFSRYTWQYPLQNKI